VGEILQETELANFIVNNLRSSLSSIGFSQEFLDALLSDLRNISVENFGKKWREELGNKYIIGFFQKIVPKYFSDYIVPVTPTSRKIIDVGCGTGILAKLYAEDKRFERVVGIDINPYPEWKIFWNEKIKFEVVDEATFPNFLLEEKPDSVVLTWTLHHMEYDEQERYFEYIHDYLPSGAGIIILEDSYSKNLIPENGKEKYEEFMKWGPEQRREIMSVYDWVANRVLAQRSKAPMPCAYRSLEDWDILLEKKRFKMITQKFIGFPDNRDINTPQSLIVARRN